MVFPILGSGLLASGYDIDNSLRFNNPDDPNLSITFGSAGDRRTFTISAWIKKGDASTDRALIGQGGTSSGNPRGLLFASSSLRFTNNTSGSSADTDVWTNAKLRDHSAWYHVVAAVDTTQGTASNRVKLYINGVHQTSLATATYPDEDFEMNWNNNVLHTVGRYPNNDAYHMDGYISEFYFIDGTQYAASDFGETDEDSGIWKPKDAKDDLTFGTNGFYLEFKETGTNQDSSGMGADTSGEDNHLAVTNLAATDQSTDTPTNNFCTFNPLTATGGTYSEGNTIITTGSDASRKERGTFGMDSGKWYWEYKLAGSSINNIYLGIGTTDTSVGAEQTGTYTYYSADSTGRIYTGGSIVDSPTAFAVDDIVSIAYNADDNQVLFYLNGVLEYTTSSVTDVTYNPFARIYYTTSEVQANFGNPSFAISSGNADANGYGNFEYAVPNGYYALCTKNLAEYG